MFKDILRKYFYVPISFLISGTVNMFFTNFITILISISAVIAGILISLKIPFKKSFSFWIKIKICLLSLVPLFVLLIYPEIETILKGDVIFRAFDKSFASLDEILIRKKYETLNAVYFRSVAGFGDELEIYVKKSKDTLFMSYENRVDTLVFEKDKNLLKHLSSYKSYQVSTNENFFE